MLEQRNFANAIHASRYFSHALGVADSFRLNGSVVIFVFLRNAQCFARRQVQPRIGVRILPG